MDTLVKRPNRVIRITEERAHPLRIMRFKNMRLFTCEKSRLLRRHCTNTQIQLVQRIDCFGKAGLDLLFTRPVAPHSKRICIGRIGQGHQWCCKRRHDDDRHQTSCELFSLSCCHRHLKLHKGMACTVRAYLGTQTGRDSTNFRYKAARHPTLPIDVRRRIRTGASPPIPRSAPTGTAHRAAPPTPAVARDHPAINAFFRAHIAHTRNDDKERIPLGSATYALRRSETYK